MDNEHEQLNQGSDKNQKSSASIKEQIMTDQ